MDYYKKNSGEKQDDVRYLVKKGEISTILRLTDNGKIGMILQEKNCTMSVFFRHIRERIVSMSLLKCPKCGELFSDSYRECPFCLEDEEFYHGKKPKNPGRRVEKHKSPSILGPALILVVVLVLGLVVYGFFGGTFAKWFPKEEKPPVVDPVIPDDPVVDDPVVADPVEITLNKTDLALTVGETAALTASGAEGIIWTSSDETIAKVDENGKVTALTVGSAMVTASADGASSAVCVVTVKASNKQLEVVTENGGSLYSPNEFSMGAGTSIDLKVAGTEATVLWSTDDHAVATVDQNGVVTGHSGGRTTLVVMAEGQTIRVTVIVN